MNFYQLWIFYWVAKKQSFTLAAKELFISQPAISTHIRNFERFYNVKVFDRTKKRIQLTEVGKRLFEYAEKIFTMLEEAEKMLIESKKIPGGTLNICASTTFGTYVLTEVLKIFKDRYPPVNIHVGIGNTTFVEDKIINLSADIGFMAKKSNLPGLEYIPLMEDILILILPPAHPLAYKNSLSIHDLNNQPLIVREKESGTRQVVDKYLKSFKIKPRITMEMSSNESIKRAVEANLGIAILSQLAVSREASEGRIVSRGFSDCKIKRNFFLIHNKNKSLSVLSKLFLVTTKEIFRSNFLENLMKFPATKH